MIYSNIFEWIACFLWGKEPFTQKKWVICSGCSFVMSNLCNSFSVTHFLWVTWANHSRLLIFGEWPERFAHLLIFGEWPEHFAHGRSFLVNDLSESLHGCSFLVSDQSDSLTSLFKKREWALVCFFKRTKSVPKNMVLVKTFFANRSFAHLSWATWANRSRSLICPERPEQYAHGGSFDMSNLSDLHSWALLNENLVAEER